MANRVGPGSPHSLLFQDVFAPGNQHGVAGGSEDVEDKNTSAASASEKKLIAELRNLGGKVALKFIDKMPLAITEGLDSLAILGLVRVTLQNYVISQISDAGFYLREWLPRQRCAELAGSALISVVSHIFFTAVTALQYVLAPFIGTKEIDRRIHRELVQIAYAATACACALIGIVSPELSRDTVKEIALLARDFTVDEMGKNTEAVFQRVMKDFRDCFEEVSKESTSKEVKEFCQFAVAKLDMESSKVKGASAKFDKLMQQMSAYL